MWERGCENGVRRMVPGELLQCIEYVHCGVFVIYMWYMCIVGRGRGTANSKSSVPLGPCSFLIWWSGFIIRCLFTYPMLKRYSWQSCIEYAVYAYAFNTCSLFCCSLWEVFLNFTWLFLAFCSSCGFRCCRNALLRRCHLCSYCCK
jgi:hypothetical protein